MERRNNNSNRIGWRLPGSTEALENYEKRKDKHDSQKPFLVFYKEFSSPVAGG